jgi:hypothetical protein
VIVNWEQAQPGMILMGNWTLVTAEEYERRQAALTPGQRYVRDVMLASFAGVTQALRGHTRSYDLTKADGR